MRRKRYFAIFLACLMCLSLIPVTPVQAANYYKEAELYVSKSSVEMSLTEAGVNKNGVVYSMELDGMPAWCIDAGKHARTGDRYARLENADETYNKLISFALYDKIVSKRVGSMIGVWNDNNYALAQALVWGYAEGCTTEQIATMIDIVLTTANKVWAIADHETNMEYAEEFAREAFEYEAKLDTIYVYSSGLDENQRLITTAVGEDVEPEYARVSSQKEHSVTDEVSLSIFKTDKETKEGLEGVTFDLYKDGIKITTVTTDKKGTAEYTFQTTYSETATAAKEYCSNYDSLSIPNQALVEAEYTSESEAQKAADEEAAEKAKAEAEKLYSTKHIYKAVETKTRAEYYLNPSSATQTVSYASGDGSGTITFQFTNTRQLGSITITKKDAETGCLVDGAVYGLYAAADIVHPDGKTGVVYEKNQLAATFPKTGADGQAELHNLYLGKYYIKEVEAPSGYVLSDEAYPVELIYAGQTVEVTDASATVTDRVQRTGIAAVKSDKELSGGKEESIFDGNGDGAQGDASLKGAVYGLYAKEDIIHPDGTTGVVQYNAVKGSVNELTASKGTELLVENTKATAGTLLATIKTDTNGEFSFENLYNGKYYIKEMEASEGYLLDDTEYEIDLSYSNQNETVVVKTASVYETVKKQAFDLYKVGQAEGSTTLKPLEGVEFTVKLECDVQRLGWEQAPVYDVLTTAADGTASSIELPYGTYRVRETKVLPNYIGGSDFFVTIEEDSRVHQSFSNHTMVNKEFSVALRILKVDSETGKVIQLSGAEFKIKALTDVTVNGKDFKAGEYIGFFTLSLLEGFYQDSWTTDENGMIAIEKRFGPGKYQLEEVKAPEGYLLDLTPVEFEVSDSSMYDISADGETPVITVRKEDTPVKGQITVEKRGEVLTGYDKETKQFVYEEKSLAGAVFEIYAEENIKNPDQVSEDLYQKGDLVTTVTTDSDGKAKTEKLPLGRYLVKEVSAPVGMVIAQEEQSVELSYKDQTTELVFAGVSYVNKRQMVKLDINKLDSDTNMPLSGAEFTIYANKDIKDYFGNIILTADETVTTGISDENGNIAFDIDLPVDCENETGTMFYVKESKRPEGYTSYEEIIYLDTAYQGQNVKEFTFCYEMYNTSTKMAIYKVDSMTGEPVIGAELSLVPLDESGEPKQEEAFVTWISTEEPFLLDRLPIGKYMLIEVSAPEGYYIAEPIVIEIKDTEEVQEFTMEDERILTDIRVEKIDSETKEAITSKEFVFGLYADKECTRLLTIVAADIENGTATFEELQYGTYYVKEIEAPDGYKLSAEIKEIIINDDLEGVGDVYIFDYENTSTIKQMGDDLAILISAGIAVTGLLFLGFAVNKKRKSSI